MPISISQFSRKQSLDLETAMARAIVNFLSAQAYPGAAGIGLIRFAQVFEEWPGSNDEFVSPGVCVLPDGELAYGPSHPTPRLLEDTWENPGEAGFGLYELSEASMAFQVVVRAPTGPERNALKAGIEQLFVDPQVLMVPTGARYGVLANMPEYFGLNCRLSLGSSRKLDGADNAMKNINEAQFVIRAEAPHVRVGPVQPLTLKIVETDSLGPIP